MPYNENLADRIRESLASLPKVEEKAMMGGLTFMVNKKMCVGILNDDMMCRIHPDVYEEVLERKGCRPMDFTGRPMKGFVFVDPDGYRTRKDMDHWIKLCLEFNRVAKASKKSTASKPKSGKKRKMKS